MEGGANQEPDYSTSFEERLLLWGLDENTKRGREACMEKQGNFASIAACVHVLMVTKCFLAYTPDLNTNSHTQVIIQFMIALR